MFLQAAAQPGPNDATQSMIVFFGCLVFTLLLVFYIFAPVPVASDQEKTRLAYLYERKEVIYENLRDLSFEYKAGKLGDADFESLRNSIEEEAAAVLAEIDQLEKAASRTRLASLPDHPDGNGVRA
jgi:Skp family chaperone for outer membrane proteins